MYPMSELRSLDLAARGIELTADQIFKPHANSLVDGVCKVNGCTGSFVSPKGLIITNHHCAYGAIQQASQGKQDYLTDGFQANTQQDEIPAPDYVVRVTEDYRDVSQEVLSAVRQDMTFLERTKAIEKKSKEIEFAAEQAAPQFRAEVAEMFAGESYVLFRYTYLKDIRLVFAPPQSVGNFGGEIDNWMWPRHTGDFSFMRAYVAPDGSSATYHADNVPYEPQRFIQVSAAGVEEEDAVFLLGYPGRTARHKTSAFLLYEQNLRLPTIIDLYNSQMAIMENAGKDNREVEIKHASRMRSLSNVEKRSRGQLQGLVRADIVKNRQDQEAELQKFIESEPANREQFGTLQAEIEAVYDQMTAAAPLEINLNQLRSASRAASFAFFVIDAAHERQKPNLDRETPYLDKNWDQSLQKLKSSVNDYHQATDQAILADILQRLALVDAEQTIPALTPLLASAEAIPTVSAQLVEQTKLDDWNFLEECLAMDVQQLNEVKDPLLQLMLQLYPTYLQIRETQKTREGELSELYGRLLLIKRRFMQTNFVPDANATLRFTCGHVRRYSPEDAVIKTPLTTLSGVIAKTTGVAPFITPAEVIAKQQAGDLGPFRSPELDDVPVAILYDTDTTGGNSGSPILNGRGELVGVNFDRCFEATINDFAWDQSYSRSIGVDIRYVLWLTGIVYGADHLLDEMGIDMPAN
ncbi:S46 family peptidase [Roseimaritima multifibrata]|nr:S46 family peptidase [Roseimaritima multifibrata]